MKKLVQTMNVELFEQTRATSVTPGNTVVIKTEFGEVLADAVVIGTNGYSSTLGLFKKYMIPYHDYIIATEPLTSEQMASIGWKDRESLSDSRNLFNYFRLSADNRIVFGGEIISQLYAKEDTELTRFFLLNTRPPYIPPEPFRKIGVDTYIKYLALKDRLF
jgi:glycine/D-amino acid oxidase-like deaminating enzyme